MKRTFNLTVPNDLERFSSRESFEALLAGFDGVEIQVLGEAQGNILCPQDVVGLHSNFFPYWLDFYLEDQAALLAEFGTQQILEMYYGGSSPQILEERLRGELDTAKRMGAAYLVLHASDATIEESFTDCRRRPDEEVVDALCELVNRVLTPEDEPILLLFENLWTSGMDFTRPEITRRLLNGVQHKNTGIMLDTGHLMHTVTHLRSQREALAYIHSLLDAHGDTVEAIRGIHLHQSLTGAYHAGVREHPPALPDDYGARWSVLFEHIFTLDQHLPFTEPEVCRLVDRIAPEYLTFEFITSSLSQHKKYLRLQQQALEK